MATNKTYVVYGAEGQELKTLKSLAAAKKLADAEGGTVLSDGECVYKATQVVAEEQVVEQTEEQVVEQEEKHTEEQETVEAEEPVAGQTEEPVAEKTEEQPIRKQKYVLLSLMNIRSKPSMRAPIIGQARPGTVVIAQSVENDWLNTADGYILYGDGKYAEKV